MKNKKLLSLALTLLMTGCSFATGTSTPNSVNNSTSSSSTSKTTISENIDYGTLTIPDMKIYMNYPGVPATPVFSNEQFKDLEITYSINNENAVKYENGVFVPLKAGYKVIVTATTEHHSTTFKITTAEFDFEAQVSAHERNWKQEGSLTGSTLFVGDSFFDTGFWSSFYNTYGKYNARTHGISATTTTDWEVFADRIVYPVQPKNIVMHCGTNNLFDDLKTSEQTIEETTRLLSKFHEKMPETQMYYFGIEPRTGAIRGLNFNDSIQRIHDTNAGIIKFCEENAWVTYLDSPSLCYNDDGSVKSEFFRDGCHPKLENYSYYVNLLNEAGLELDANPNITRDITDISTELGQTVGASKSIQYLGTPLVREFALKGKIDIEDRSNNSHIEIRFGEVNDRFLFWDSGSNGKYQMGFACNGAYTNAAPARSVYTHTKGETLTLDFELVVSSNNAYLYVNNTLELIYLNLPEYPAVLFGSEATKAKFYDMEAKTKVDDLSDYNEVIARSEIQKYEGLKGGDGLSLSRGSLTGKTILRDYDDFVVNNGTTFNLGGLGANDPNYTSPNRDYIISVDGSSNLVGDVVVEYTFKVVNSKFENIDALSASNVSAMNYFHVLTVSTVEHVGMWGEQHLLYWRTSDTTVQVTTLGSSSGVSLQNVTDIEVECKVVRSGSMVYVAMCTDGVWSVTEKSYDTSKALSIWLSSENINLSISNLNYSKDASVVAAAKTTIGK